MGSQCRLVPSDVGNGTSTFSLTGSRSNSASDCPGQYCLSSGGVISAGHVMYTSRHGACRRGRFRGHLADDQGPRPDAP